MSVQTNGDEGAAASTTSNTEVIDPQEAHQTTLRLRLTGPATKTTSTRRVSWTTDTVDNEFMNKKKSKCCCQYRKPKMWDESTDEDENQDDCEHCHGHKKSDFNSKRNKENCRHKSLDDDDDAGDQKNIHHDHHHHHHHHH